MTPEIFGEWLRRQGHEVVRTESSWWYDASPRVYQAFPYHWAIRPAEAELTGLLRRRNALALRYSTPLDAPAGRVSYHIVCDDPAYALERLDRRTRKNVTTGLARCKVERIPLARLAEEGWALERDSAQRQRRESGVDERRWSRRYLAAADLPGFEAWGALVDGRLAASLLAFQMDDCCELISQQCLSELLDARPNHAICFVATQAYVRRPGAPLVFYTLQSLDAPPSVDDFKLRMGYRLEPLRQRVMFHPWASLAVQPVAHELLRQALRLRPASRLLAKAEGMVRFHLQGLRPVDQQPWPELGDFAERMRGAGGGAAPATPRAAQRERSSTAAS